MGTTLTHQSDDAAVAYLHAVQLSNQPAVPISAVDGAIGHDEPSFGVDTLGGKFPRSYEGNFYALVFVNHAPGRRDPTVTVFATHHAANTVTGLGQWLAFQSFLFGLTGNCSHSSILQR
jgi:hypothetical protein